MQRMPHGEKGSPCPARVTPPSTAKVQKDPICPGSGWSGDCGGSGCDEVVMSCDADVGGIPLLQNGCDLTKAKRNSKIK